MKCKGAHEWWTKWIWTALPGIWNIPWILDMITMQKCEFNQKSACHFFRKRYWTWLLQILWLLRVRNFNCLLKTPLFQKVLHLMRNPHVETPVKAIKCEWELQILLSTSKITSCLEFQLSTQNSVINISDSKNLGVVHKPQIFLATDNTLAKEVDKNKKNRYNIFYNNSVPNTTIKHYCLYYFREHSVSNFKA